MRSNIEIRTVDNLKALSQTAVQIVISEAARAIAARARFSLVLSGGSTPATLYQLLASATYRDEIAWERTQLFWGDERSVSPDHKESNYGQVQRTLLNSIQVRPENVHRIRGELPPVDAAKDYSKRLIKLIKKGDRFRRFDLVLMGMGSDGHIASLFPGAISNQEDKTLAMAVRADYAGRPSDRVTLTPRAFNHARRILFLVSGEEKARAAKFSIEGKRDPLTWPAHRIQPESGSSIWLLDRASASLLDTGKPDLEITDTRL